MKMKFYFLVMKGNCVNFVFFVFFVFFRFSSSFEIGQSHEKFDVWTLNGLNLRSKTKLLGLNSFSSLRAVSLNVYWLATFRLPIRLLHGVTLLLAWEWRCATSGLKKKLAVYCPALGSIFAKCFPLGHVLFFLSTCPVAQSAERVCHLVSPPIKVAQTISIRGIRVLWHACNRFLERVQTVDIPFLYSLFPYPF